MLPGSPLDHEIRNLRPAPVPVGPYLPGVTYQTRRCTSQNSSLLGNYALEAIPWGGSLSIIQNKDTYGDNPDGDGLRELRNHGYATAIDDARTYAQQADSDLAAASQAVADQQNHLDAARAALLAAQAACTQAQDALDRLTLDLWKLSLKLTTLRKRRAAQAVIDQAAADYDAKHRQKAAAQLAFRAYPGGPFYLLESAKFNVQAAQRDLVTYRGQEMDKAAAAEILHWQVTLDQANLAAVQAATKQGDLYQTFGGVGNDGYNAMAYYYDNYPPYPDPLTPDHAGTCEYRMVLDLGRAAVTNEGSYELAWQESFSLCERDADHDLQQIGVSRSPRSAVVAAGEGDIRLYTEAFLIPRPESLGEAGLVGPAEPVDSSAIETQGTLAILGTARKFGFPAFTSDAAGGDEPAIYLAQSAGVAPDPPPGHPAFSGQALYTPDPLFPQAQGSSTLSPAVNRYGGTLDDVADSASLGGDSLIQQAASLSPTTLDLPSGLRLVLSQEDGTARVDGVAAATLGRSWPDDGEDPPLWMDDSARAYRYRAKDGTWAAASKFRFRFAKLYPPVYGAGTVAKFILRTHLANGQHADDERTIDVTQSAGHKETDPTEFTAWEEVTANPGEFIELMQVTLLGPDHHAPMRAQSTNVRVQVPPGES